MFYFVIFGVSTQFDNEAQKFLYEKFHEEKRDSVVQVMHNNKLYIVSFEEMRVYPTENGELIDGYNGEDLHYSLKYIHI